MDCVPGSVRGTGMGPRMREDNGRGAGLTEGSWDERWIVVPAGVGSSRGTGMGPRIREDNGRGMRAKR